MNILTEKDENEKGTLKSISNFCKTFAVGSILKKGNAYKQRGVSAISILKYLMQLVFTQKSMYMNYVTSYDEMAFGMDAVYRFLRSSYINWNIILLNIAERIITLSLQHLTSDDRINAIVVDDTFYGRTRSKHVELSANTYDHASKGQKYKCGFRLLTLIWTDGVTQIPLLFRHMSSEKQKLRLREIDPSIDKRSCGYKARIQAMSTIPMVLLELLEMLARTKIRATHVLFDSWFTYPSTVMNIRGLGFHVVGRLKNSRTIHYLVDGKTQTLSQIYISHKKRPGKSKYLLSVMAKIHNQAGDTLDVRIVFVRDRSNKKKWIAILSTDLELDEETVIQLYGRRWSIEVFFKVCKSYLNLGREFQQLSFDAITAHTAIVFMRYMLLALEERNLSDNRTIGELFFFCCDELPDLKFSEVLVMLLDILRESLYEMLFLTCAQINTIIDTFIAKIPACFRHKLQFCPSF